MQGKVELVVRNVDEIRDAVVKPVGNGGRINFPKKFVNRKVKVIVLGEGGD